MKISNKIGLYFFTLTTIITISVMSVFYIKTENNIKNLITKHLKTTIQSRKHHIETFLQGYQETVEILAAGVVFKELLSSDKNAPDYEEKVKRVNIRLKEAANIFQKTFAVSLLNKQGIIVESTDKTLIGVDRSVDEIFLKARKKPQIKDVHLYKGKPQIFAISISARVFVGDEFLGVVVIECNAETLFKITLDRTGLGETGEVYLVNRNGHMISPSYFLSNNILNSEINAFGAQKKPKEREKFHYDQHLHEPAVYKNYREVEVLGLCGFISKMQWCLMAEMNKKEALAPLTEIKFVFFILLLAIPIISWAVNFFTSKAICEPLYKLHQGAKIIGRGNLDYRVGTKVKDEIGKFSREFDEMTKNLKKITNKLYNEIRERKQVEAELKGMKDNLEIEVRKKTKALIDAQSKLIYSEKLAAMGQLAGIIGHEFRNQLAVMLNATYFLKMKLARGDEKVKQHFSVLEEEIAAADRIIKNILAFARTKEPEFERVSLKSILLGSLKKVNISEKIEVVTDIEEELPEIYADKIQLTQVFINIILNAVQSIEDRGRVTIKANRTDKFVNILFKDTGCGIKKEDKEKIFEPLFSAKAQGTGLGLAIAKMFIQGHGGNIHVESKIGEGTIMTVKLAIE